MHSKYFIISFLFVFLLAVVNVGCSSGVSDIVAPSGPEDSVAAIDPGEASLDGTNSHFALGFYSCIADPVAGTLDIEPLREANQHINAVWYLQSGPEQLVTLDSPPQFSNGGKQLDVDVGITHPINNPIFNGFDVRLIFVTEGNLGGWADPSIRIAGPHQTRLMNPDGYTRWWNPEEFTHGGIYGYIQGSLGMHILPGDAAILNGFKYYSNDLDPWEDFADIDITNRGMFSANTKLIRHFTMSLMGGLKFNYAVDASWSKPNTIPPTGPDDFPIKANQLEPYRIEVDEWVNTLWNDGSSSRGNVFYRITAYDWQGSQTIGGAFLEVPNLDIENALNNIVDIGPNHVTWEFRAFNPDIYDSGPCDVLVSVYSPEGNFQGPYTGVYKLLRAYTLVQTEVADHELSPVIPVAIAVAETSTDINKHEPVTFNAEESYDPDGINLTYLWDFDGDGTYGDEYDSGTDENPTKIFHPGGSFEVDVKVVDDDMLEGTLDETITVDVYNQPPTAAMEMSGNEPYYANAWYTFDASTSFDVDGEVSVYEWDFDYDGMTFEADEYGQVLQYAFEEDTFDIMLRVLDDDGGEDFLDEALTRTFIYKENLPPEITGVDFSRTTTLKASEDERVTLHVYWDDPDVVDNHTITWTADNGENDEQGVFTEIDENTFEWVSPDYVGHYNLTVRVTDLFGVYDEDDSINLIVTKYPTGSHPYNYNVSVMAPDWSLPDVPDENIVDFADYTPGNVVLLHFFKRNC